MQVGGLTQRIAVALQLGLEAVGAGERHRLRGGRNAADIANRGAEPGATQSAPHQRDRTPNRPVDRAADGRGVPLYLQI